MNRKLIIIIVLANLLIGAGVVLYIHLSQPKTYYIDLEKVYNEFELKKELEQKMEAMVALTNEHLDSLEMKARVINNDIKSSPSDQSKISEYNTLAEIYSSRSQQFDEQKNKLAQEYDQQIWSQLNEYIREYGKEKNCDFILAGNGDGSIMYAKGSNDITDKMIIYVNDKYQGK